MRLPKPNWSFSQRKISVNNNILIKGIPIIYYGSTSLVLLPNKNIIFNFYIGTNTTNCKIDPTSKT